MATYQKQSGRRKWAERFCAPRGFARALLLAVWTSAIGGPSLATRCQAGPVVINSSNTLAAAMLPPSEITRVAALRYYFSHASIGDNIVNGIFELNYWLSSTEYPLTFTYATDVPPTNTSPGLIYSYSRGDPGWQAKVDLFAGYVSNGWHYPKADVVINKFCFIDPDANLDYYLNSMVALEQTNLRTWFVYATMPLTTNEDDVNATRNIFNQGLRKWVQDNHRILYDIADIEAHDTNGAPQTFVYTNQVFQKLWPAYSTDGGHLNDTGMQTTALGLYALGAALLTADRDGDGMPDWWEMANGLNPLDPSDATADPDQDGMSNLKEYLSGTDPQNPQSVLKLQVDTASAGNCQIEFTAASNVVHTVQYADSIRPGTGWQNLARIPAQSIQRTIVVVDSSTPGKSARYYRVMASRVP